MKPRAGIEVLEDIPGSGNEIERHHFYRMSLKMWLNKGDAIRWTRPFGIGIEGMRVGGKRTLKISPHMAYRDKGVAGMVPPNAVLKVEVEIHAERDLK